MIEWMVEKKRVKKNGSNEENLKRRFKGTDKYIYFILVFKAFCILSVRCRNKGRTVVGKTI